MRIRRIMRLAMLTGFLALTASFISFAGAWRQDEHGWWYQYNDGTYVNSGIYEIEGDIYIFNGDGYILTNTWFQSPNTGDWYYCQGGGQVAQNKWIGNYYCGSDGKMLKDAWVGEYYVGSDGKWVEGKSKDSSNSGSSKGTSNTSSSKGTSGSGSSKETTYSGSAYDLNSSAHYAQIDSSSSEKSSSFTKGWIYGFYNNVGQTGYYDHHCVHLQVNKDSRDGGNANFYFSLYDIAGHNYDLYNDFDPSGDILYGYKLGNYSQYLKSELSGKKYYMTYDGYDTIKIYWRDTSWLDESNNCIIFKKVTEYYNPSEITMGNNSSYDSEDSDSDSDSPFADRKINVTKSIDSIVNSDELETADIHYN